MRRPADSNAPSTIEGEERLDAAPVDLGVHAVGRQCGEMIIQLELAFEGRLDEHLLARAVDLLLDAEPVVGCRLVVATARPYWQRVPKADQLRLTVAHLPEEYDTIRRTGLDATANVQIAVCLGRWENGDRLNIKMAHEVGDGVGLQMLSARLSSIYSELCTNSSYRPRPHVGARRDFTQISAELPALAYPRLVWDFISYMVPRQFPRRTHALSLPTDSIGPWVPVIMRLPATRLSFLSSYGKARGATLNDMLLAAAYRALASSGPWDGKSGLRISITVDLRRWFRPLADGASICNLSSFEYPFLGRNLGKRFDDTLANVAALTRRRKRSWPGLAPALVGHFVMKQNGYDGLLQAGLRQRQSRTSGAGQPLTLSNEGSLDKVRLRFGSHAPVSAHILPPFLALPAVHICISSYSRVLTLAAVTPENGRATIEAFITNLFDELPAGDVIDEIARRKCLMPADSWGGRTALRQEEQRQSGQRS